MIRLAIGCDYSTKRVDFALVGPDKVLRRLMVDLRCPLLEALQLIEASLKNLGGAPLYLEEPWTRPGAGIQTALKIHRIAYHVEAMAALVDIPVEFVPISRWRSQVLGRVPTRKLAKAGALIYVKQAFGIETSDDNVADAICLGAYGQRQEVLKEHLALAGKNGA